MAEGGPPPPTEGSRRSPGSAGSGPRRAAAVTTPRPDGAGARPGGETRPARDQAKRRRDDGDATELLARYWRGSGGARGRERAGPTRSHPEPGRDPAQRRRVLWGRPHGRRGRRGRPRTPAPPLAGPRTPPPTRRTREHARVRTAGPPRGGAAAARWAHNPKVGGSNPPPATKPNCKLDAPSGEGPDGAFRVFPDPQLGGPLDAVRVDSYSQTIGH